MTTTETIATSYEKHLTRFITEGGEDLLAVAYDIGRAIANTGAGSLALVDVHHTALARLADQGRLRPGSFERAAVFLAEALAPVEMALRGYREANASLHSLNQTLQRQNAEIEQAKRETESANSELEAFSYAVAHDLRSPLRGVQGFAQILLEEHAKPLDEEGRALVSRVLTAAQRMQQMIGDLLTLSRITREDIQRTDVDLSLLCAGIVDDLRRTEPKRVVDISISPHLIANCDSRLIQIALVNLLSNAWKYTGKQLSARIDISARLEGSQVVYQISDNGVGFNPASAKQLFKPFRRLHAEADFPGTGVGLATVQRVINRHGGQIWAESSPGHGATFFFTVEPRNSDAGAAAKLSKLGLALNRLLPR